MEKVNILFQRMEKLTHTDSKSEHDSILNTTLQNDTEQIKEETCNIDLYKSFLWKILHAIDEVATEIKNDESILVSVNNQKILRRCFQLVTTLGICPCLIPGLGLNTKQRCAPKKFANIKMNDTIKYEILVKCINSLTTFYEVPVMKTIIISLHLADYLAALIQLSFAPLKKPGTYSNFVMTDDMYITLNEERTKFKNVYENLVVNCFQPILMKELLVLQSVKDPKPPAFAMRVISKELSRRLVLSGGLLSLIRCFIESYNIDAGFEWKKIDMICRIVAVKHGYSDISDYLQNMTLQLHTLLSSTNPHYLSAAVACSITLLEKYPDSQYVKNLRRETFEAFDYNRLNSDSNMPGTIILTPQEVEQKTNILHACVCIANLQWPLELLAQNIHTLFLIGIKCNKNEELKTKLKEIIIIYLEKLNKYQILTTIKTLLFGKRDSPSKIFIEEYDAGLIVKSILNKEEKPTQGALLYMLHIFNTCSNTKLISLIFESALDILTEVTVRRQNKNNNDLLTLEEEPVLFDDVDDKYVIILQFLTEISTTPKVINSIKSNPSIVFNFIENFILKQHSKSNECTTIALVLLNTILSNKKEINHLEMRFVNLKKVLKNKVRDGSDLNNILYKEALSFLSSAGPHKSDSEYEKAISDAFDSMLPVRAHGLMQITKLIEIDDAETISKKHYILCLFQEHLKDEDTYIYLAAINGLAALCTHFPEDVLHVLCKEFLEMSFNKNYNETNDNLNSISELRMKIGDVIVKVTKRLGEMAIVHRTILLNTMLCGCRDEEPLIRMSALSNLAEIALVLHYKIGSIIYEVLLCIWSIIETDKAIECRRAAVMVVSSLIKGLGKDTLVELKENLLPVYRTLKILYGNFNEDSVVRLHAQIALEELNDIVKQFLTIDLNMESNLSIAANSKEIVYK